MCGNMQACIYTLRLGPRQWKCFSPVLIPRCAALLVQQRQRPAADQLAVQSRGALRVLFREPGGAVVGERGSQQGGGLLGWAHVRVCNQEERPGKRFAWRGREHGAPGVWPHTTTLTCALCHTRPEAAPSGCTLYVAHLLARTVPARPSLIHCRPATPLPPLSHSSRPR